MTTFFSAIQGKFKAGYHGRYMGHILEQVAAFRPEIVKPILDRAPLKNKQRPRSLTQIVSTETSYLLDEIIPRTDGKQEAASGDDFQSNADDAKDRQSDIEITLSGDRYLARVIVEIKMLDKFHENQLNDYISWVRRRVDLEEDRAVVVITASPLDSDSQKLIEENGDVISHMYLSDLVTAMDASICDSELVTLFKNYLTEKGYAMYQLQAKEDETDFNALLSYMVLSFLPNNSGHGRVAKSKNIARGPVVFSNIIQNWQLVSDRLANELKFKRIPTVRYYPQQSVNGPAVEPELPKEKILELRRTARTSKDWGRYWLCSDCVCLDGKLRLEWGQVLQIQRGRDSAITEIECNIYALIRKDKEQLSEAKLISLGKNGVRDPRLYNPEDFMKLLRECIDDAAITAIEKYPDIENQLPWLGE